MVCNATGDTNYDAGLGRAKGDLEGGRPGATEEIYVISDGQPDPAYQDGHAIASLLKTSGVDVGGTLMPVTIATIMLAGTDVVLDQDRIDCRTARRSTPSSTIRAN